MTVIPNLPETLQAAVSSPVRKHPLHGWRTAALIAIAALVVAAAGASFTESYRGLFQWAAHHGEPGVWARIWPLQVDVFIAVPELVLFVALVDGWRLRYRVAAWLAASGGLAVSVAGNVGHVTRSSLTDHATWAVPPLAAAAALAFGLMVVKRVTAAHSRPGAAGLNGHADRAVKQAAELFAADLTRGRLPRQRELRRALRVGQARAKRVQAHLAALVDTHHAH